MVNFLLEKVWRPDDAPAPHTLAVSHKTRVNIHLTRCAHACVIEDCGCLGTGTASAALETTNEHEEMAMDADETQERIHALETAQATQAATTAGMEATQTATTGGLQAAQAAAQAGTWAVMATGFISLIVGIFLGMTIAKD